MSRQRSDPLDHTSGFPRPRGDEPDVAIPALQDFAFSPPARG